MCLQGIMFTIMIGSKHMYLTRTNSFYFPSSPHSLFHVPRFYVCSDCGSKNNELCETSDYITLHGKEMKAAEWN